MTRQLPGFHRVPPVTVWWQPWFDDALCKQVDPRLFFPKRGTNRGVVSQARRVCAACPVTGECLEYALTWDEQHGIWGGLTVAQRRKLARERDAA